MAVPIIGSVVRGWLGRAFGPPPFNPATGLGDPGLFGPGSASWQVISEPAAIVGGLRALLVQLLHPLAMAGVADHSRFRDDPLGRLRRTSDYVVGTTFGSTAEAIALLHTVRGVHRRVRGTAPDGRLYRADDPHLVAWVSLALTSSFLAADRAYAWRPAPPAVADAFVAEQSRVAALLDPRVDLGAIGRDPELLAALRRGELELPMIADGSLPRDVAGVAAALAAFRPELEVTRQGREALRFLLWPSISPPLKAGFVPLLAGAVATLDPAERRLLGLPAEGPAGTAVAAVSRPVRGMLLLARVASGPSPALTAATGRSAVAAW
jgi:uncharacterized protein (DUF2236 family)